MLRTHGSFVEVERDVEERKLMVDLAFVHADLSLLPKLQRSSNDFEVRQ